MPNDFTRDLSVPDWLTRASVVGIDGCLLWTKCTDARGYGMTRVKGQDGKWRSRRVHILAAEAYLPPRPSPKHHALHRCDTPSCYNPAHLWWGTQADNNRDRDQKGRHVALHGEAHARTKLTTPQAREIKRRWQVGDRRGDLAREFGVSTSTVWEIATGRSWKYLEATDVSH